MRHPKIVMLIALPLIGLIIAAHGIMFTSGWAVSGWGGSSDMGFPPIWEVVRHSSWSPSLGARIVQKGSAPRDELRQTIELRTFCVSTRQDSPHVPGAIVAYPASTTEPTYSSLPFLYDEWGWARPEVGVPNDTSLLGICVRIRVMTLRAPRSFDVLNRCHFTGPPAVAKVEREVRFTDRLVEH